MPFGMYLLLGYVLKGLSVLCMAGGIFGALIYHVYKKDQARTYVIITLFFGGILLGIILIFPAIYFVSKGRTLNPYITTLSQCGVFHSMKVGTGARGDTIKTEPKFTLEGKKVTFTAVSPQAEKQMHGLGSGTKVCVQYSQDSRASRNNPVSLFSPPVLLNVRQQP